MLSVPSPWLHGFSCLVDERGVDQLALLGVGIFDVTDGVLLPATPSLPLAPTPAGHSTAVTEPTESEIVQALVVAAPDVCLGMASLRLSATPS
jgi:hypothetical protein